MSHTNPFRETKSVSGSPFEITLSWNAKKGVWFGRQNDRGVKMKNLAYFLIEPMLFMVTGRQKTGDGEIRYWSNLCCQKEGYKSLTVKQNDGYRTKVIGSGTWRDLKPTFGSGPSWTKVNAILLAYAKASYEADDGSWSEYEVVTPNVLAQLRMRGRTIAHTKDVSGRSGGWGGFRDTWANADFPVTEENLAGFLVKQTESIEVIGNSFDKEAVGYYPVFNGRPMDTSQEKDARMLLLAKPMFRLVNDYLDLEKENAEGKKPGMVEQSSSFPSPSDEPVLGPILNEPKELEDVDLPF